MNDYMITRL